MTSVDTERTITVTVNGVPHEATVPVRRLLSDALRHDLEFTGTHVGCEHGVCGACTVIVDGEAMRSCLMLAVQAHGRSIRTVERLRGSEPQSPLHPLQAAFQETHALQCGFCTPGFLMSLEPFVRDAEDPTDEEIREALAGNLCRCTGYVAMIEAVRLAAQRLR